MPRRQKASRRDAAPFALPAARLPTHSFRKTLRQHKHRQVDGNDDDQEHRAVLAERLVCMSGSAIRTRVRVGGRAARDDSGARVASEDTARSSGREMIQMIASGVK